MSSMNPKKQMANPKSNPFRNIAHKKISPSFLRGYRLEWKRWGRAATKHSGESLFFQTSAAIVIVFLAEMDRIPCCDRPEYSGSNV